ncbi:AraC family transcriptional regulator [Paraburkholderia denitrificans]|uniref:AraC family transcriptional regulator n=1 Tax=Paraburkholderia denitrificans TaxID=694025 RepID=A0ABW0J953_9BURK
MLHRVEFANSALPGIRIVEILSDRRFPRHAHDEYGVGVMLEGGHVSWSGRGQVEVGPGYVITVNPNELHDGIPVQGAPRRWRMMYVDPCVIAEFGGAEMAAREFPLPVVDNIHFAQRFASALYGLPDVTASEATESVLDLFGTLFEQERNVQSLCGPSRSVQRMLERIHDDPANAPSLEELADIAALTPYTALRRFRRELGTTPHAYLLQYRVRQAYKAISEGKTLAEAALVAGFADQPHMTRAFVRQFGITPGQRRCAQIHTKLAK